MQATERIKITETLIRTMRLACTKKKYSVGGIEYRTERAHSDTDPYCWWYENKIWFLSIRCQHNAHGEYYLGLSPNGPEATNPPDWFCFLQDGKWGKKFLHLRHVVYFDELQLIVRALTDLELCISESAAHQYLDNKAA